MYNVKYSSTGHPAYAETIATMSELTKEAFQDAINTRRGHAAKVWVFEVDADHPGHADALTDRCEVYTIEPKA